MGIVNTTKKIPKPKKQTQDIPESGDKRIMANKSTC